MPSSHTTIHVDPKSDVATLADKIVRSAARKIFLVVDNNARIAFHVLNFQLLRREAEAAGKDLVVISSSIRVQALATKAGLSTRQTIPTGRQAGIVEDDGADTPPTLRSEFLVGSPTARLDQRVGGTSGEERTISVVRLGTRRVSDIIPRHSQDIGSADATRVNSADLQEGSRLHKQQKEKKSDVGKRGLAREIGDAFLSVRQENLTHSSHAAQEDQRDMKSVLMKEERAQDSTLREFLHTQNKNAAEDQEESSPSSFVGRRARHGGIKDERAHSRRRIHLRIGQGFGAPFLALTRKGKIKFPFVWISFVVVIILIGIFTASTVLPTVTVVLTPHIQKATLQIPVHVDTTVSQIDTAKHTIPGQVIQESAQNSQTFTVGAKQNVQTFAVGQIRVFNQYSSAPQALVKNTRFVSQNGLLFRTTQNVVIPGAQIQNGQVVASSLAVEVIAAEIGDKYNVGPSTFSIPGFQGTPKFTAFYGKSESAMKGGFSGTAAVVSDADIAQAKDALSKLANNQVQDKLKSHIPSGFLLADGAIEIEPPAIVISAKSGDLTDSFSGTIQNSVRAVIFRQDDVKAVTDSYLKNEYKGDASMDALPQADVRYNFQTKDFSKGKFDINLQIDQVFASHIDTRTIATMVRGMSEANVRSYLSSYPGIDQAMVTFWPFWVHSVPDNQERISLKVQYP